MCIPRLSWHPRSDLPASPFPQEGSDDAAAVEYSLEVVPLFFLPVFLCFYMYVGCWVGPIEGLLLIDLNVRIYIDFTLQHRQYWFVPMNSWSI